MSKKFYDFIAKRIDSFFQSSASEGALLKGESFCLKLDDEEMVESVTAALKELAEKKNAMGVYNYPDKYNPVYTTFTLRVQDDEIIIAAQVDGMTNDFLCATLRNAANELQKPILMISANPIDSAKSGSRDMSASGMPFYSDNIIGEIRQKVNSSTQLTFAEKRILHYELGRRDADVFSDKASLYEYSDLLSILNGGKINEENYSGFRLFPIDAKFGYQNSNQKQIDKDVKDNNYLFEKIDRGIRFGNLDIELAKDFEEGFITKIEKEQKADPEGWSRHFTYGELVNAMEKKKAKQDNPLKLEDTDFYAYGEMPLNTLDDKLFIRNEGTQTTKKRTKNILIFNPDKYPIVHLRVNCNTRILNDKISVDDAVLEREGKDLIFKFIHDGVSFHKLEILDKENSVKYVLKVCIIDLLQQYLMPTVKHNFVIDYKKTKKNSRIKLIGIDTNLTFNANSFGNRDEKLEDNELYSCSFDSKLHLHTTEEELSNYGSGIKIDINFAGLSVPFVLFPDEIKSVEITGRKILKDKFSNKKSFEFDDNDGNSKIYSDTQEYFAKSNLLRELRAEKYIIDRKLLCGRSVHFYDFDTLNIKSVDLKLPQELQNAYINMLEGFGKCRTIPTLAYLDGELKDLVKIYLESFDMCFANLTEGANLSFEQENALLLGTISIGIHENEILLTPFHPLNLKYQIVLQQEKEVQHATDIVIDRINSVNLLPYIRRNKRIYKVSDQMYSLEWRYYAPIEDRKYRGNRKFIPRLVEEKITEFSSHFRYIFDDINNRTIKINLINMGDCSDVFVGISQYFIHAINKNPDIDQLKRFEIHIYNTNKDNKLSNAFSQIREYNTLKQFLDSMKLFIENGTSMNSLDGVLSKNVECYFHEDTGKEYIYAHISFYEMESEITSEQATMSQIETGISLGGIISGVPSSKYGHKYRTGFGTKYALDTDLIKMAANYNALIQVGDTGNPYHKDVSISTQIDTFAEEKMEYIYNCSNWVVFVDPKVDLDFFSEKEAKSDLLIIHYSDQYTTSSGYDAITVTHKSQQYSRVIQEFLEGKGVSADLNDIHKIINLFNAVNGDWLLRLVSSKKGIGDTTFGREKISIVAAIKFMLAFLKHSNIVWVPISLEEMLRVSGGAGLTKGDGVLSAKNLGFEKGPTSDDLLFMGLDYTTDDLKIYLYPVEVKTGNNDTSVIRKAFQQTMNTASGLERAFNPTEELRNTILYKINRNFLMQLLITSCKKMAVYHVDDSQDWNAILDKFRSCLLNEKYCISTNVQEVLGKGAVLSFRKGVFSRKTSFKEGSINFIEMPENDEFGLILDSVMEIYNDIRNNHNELLDFEKVSLRDLTGDLSKLEISLLEKIEDGEVVSDESLAQPIEEEPITPIVLEVDKEAAITSEKHNDTSNNDIENDIATKGMNVMFGTNQQNDQPVFWNPNDTGQLFHTNTGIIGTMGTGKTQFTKSLITQLYRESNNNIDGRELGILIFDYKGDYNESKEDFIKATAAKVLKPYHLPFNPLALTKSKVFKPLLPIHTANAFKDTISKVYGLGAKQQNTLFQCIIDAYSMSGITSGEPATWDNEAPTFDQVYQIYVNDDEIKKNDSLAAAMDKLHQFQIFENVPSQTKGLFDILKGVVVIDLSGYDADIQSLIVAITLDLFYAQMQATGSSKMDGRYRQLTKLILVDEADNFMCEGFSSLKKILKEGREFGVGTILSTQFLKHFGSGDDDYAKYILTWIVHNVSDLKGSDIDFVFKTEPKSSDSQHLYNDIKSLTIHHSIVKIGTAKPVYIKDKAFWELYQELT